MGRVGVLFVANGTCDFGRNFGEFVAGWLRGIPADRPTNFLQVTNRCRDIGCIDIQHIELPQQQRHFSRFAAIGTPPEAQQVDLAGLV